MALLGSSFLPQQTMLHMPNLKPLQRKSSIIKCDKEKISSGSGPKHNRVVRIQRKIEFKREVMFSGSSLNAVEDDNKTQVLDAAISLMIN
ncbi:hypothetical protein P3X46_006937 [Hevea brasiliensis]|uniref:Uncharacterized protein n=1 Tax=Hevea brasiliensis TaxID=3981 RepID=A0ABQ9MRT9_HEVBR|nr:hypothetical protein P3X46_006937 [Hevea brasiliensis]